MASIPHYYATHPTLGNRLHSSPPKKKLSATEPHAAHKGNKERNYRRNMAFELDGQWVGPMPPKDFLRELLPVTSAKLAAQPAPDDAIFESLISKYTSETDVYNHFIKHVTTTGIFPGYTILNTSQHPDNQNESTMAEKPDMAVYKEEVAKSSEKTSPTHFSSMELAIEWKGPALDKDCHPFSDAPTDKQEKDGSYLFELQRDASVDCRGQLGLYARTMLARQHRTSCFVVYIGDPMARFIRFDREGAIVSAAFDFRKEGSLLQEFFWRFANAADSVRGLHPTVTVATEEEAAIAKQHLREWAPKREREILKIEITNEIMANYDESEEAKLLRGLPAHHVFVWEAFATPHSVTGRGTRGYPAWDPFLNRVVFLKDTWRSKGLHIEKETDILRRLNEKKVRNIPKVLCGGDVQGNMQSTLTTTFSREPWNRGAKPDELHERQHNRFLIDKIGKPLYEFPGSKVFVMAIRDAFLAHRDAYENVNVLHRDISSGNILIIKNDHGSFGGLLIDWDLARDVNDLQNGPRQLSRSGTWQFMSIHVLRTVGKLHTLQDDLESFLWVTLYGTVRYMKTSKIRNLGAAMRSLFDSFNDANEDEVSGGDSKAKFLRSFAPLGENFEVLDNPNLTFLIHSLRLVFLLYDNYLGGVSGAASALRLMDATLSVECARQQALAQHSMDDLDAKNHDKMEQLFKKALDADGWPVDDASADNLAQDSPLLSLSVPTSKAEKRKSPDERSQELFNNKKQKACELTFQLKVPATR